MNSTIRSTLIGLAAAGALLPAMAAAEAMDGYLTDKGGAVVKAPRAGVCVRTRQWTPALAIAECDPDLVKKPMAAPRAEPMRPAPKKAAKKKKKAKPMNVQYKIELQGMPFDKAQMTADNKKEADKFLAGLGKANKRAKRGPVTIGPDILKNQLSLIQFLPVDPTSSDYKALEAAHHQMFQASTTASTKKDAPVPAKAAHLYMEGLLRSIDHLKEAVARIGKYLGK